MSVVLADLGSTNARLAFLKDGKISAIYHFACDDFEDPITLISSFLHGYVPDAKYAIIGVPGVIMSGKICWTNRDWTLEEKTLKKQLGLKQVVLLNDLQVQGEALPFLKKTDFVFFQGRKMLDGPRVLMNIGTGLGSCFIINKQVYASEYGQTFLDAGIRLEDKISGPGFKRLYQQISENKDPISAVTIADAYQKGVSSAVLVYESFYAELAKAVMNLAMTLKATGGIYLCGGILDETSLKKAHFSELVCEHPKMKALLQTIPICFIKKRDFAFLGLVAVARKYGLS